MTCRFSRVLDSYADYTCYLIATSLLAALLRAALGLATVIPVLIPPVVGDVCRYNHMARPHRTQSFQQPGVRSLPTVICGFFVAILTLLRGVGLIDRMLLDWLLTVGVTVMSPAPSTDAWHSKLPNDIVAVTLAHRRNYHVPASPDKRKLQPPGLAGHVNLDNLMALQKYRDALHIAPAASSHDNPGYTRRFSRFKPHCRTVATLGFSVNQVLSIR